MEALGLGLSAIIPATDNFSPVNKLGQGGFGTVYKGLLANDQKIAVKRLSKTSGQGIEEFKNEVALIADAAKKVKVDTEPCVEHKVNSKISFEVLCSWCYMSDVLWVLKEWNTKGLRVSEAGNGIPLYAVHGQVKKLEEVGIGRPSTYASTLKVL